MTPTEYGTIDSPVTVTLEVVAHVHEFVIGSCLGCGSRKLHGGYIVPFHPLAFDGR
jgi:hypothetical protein